MKYEREGNIEFGFSDDWVPLKYDDSQFYRGPVSRLGADRAAVDFIGASTAASRLLLLEVKDSRNHEVENRERLTSGELAAEVISKVWDTIGALYAGCRARKYAKLHPFASLLETYPTTIQAVLLLEEDPLPQAGPSGYLSTAKKFARQTALSRRGDLLERLQSRLKSFKISAFVFDCQSVPTSAGWTANPVVSPV